MITGGRGVLALWLAGVGSRTRCGPHCAPREGPLILPCRRGAVGFALPGALATVGGPEDLGARLSEAAPQADGSPRMTPSFRV